MDHKLMLIPIFFIFFKVMTLASENDECASPIYLEMKSQIYFLGDYQIRSPYCPLSKPK